MPSPAEWLKKVFQEKYDCAVRVRSLKKQRKITVYFGARVEIIVDCHLIDRLRAQFGNEIGFCVSTADIDLDGHCKRLYRTLTIFNVQFPRDGEYIGGL